MRLEATLSNSTQSAGDVVPGDGNAARARCRRQRRKAYPASATVENAEARHTKADSGAETAAKVAVGAAAGALLGQVLGGDTESTLKGAAAGTVARAIVAITSRYGDATLEAGSLVTVRTQEPIRLD